MRTVKELAVAYSNAIDSYRTDEAREIAGELAPILVRLGAVDASSALRYSQVMRLGLWVESTPDGDQIQRG